MPMLNPNDPKKGFKLPKIKYEESNKKIVSHSGIHALLHILDATDLGVELAQCLPENGSNRSKGNYNLSLLLIATLLAGHDSLDDLEEFDDNELIESLFDGKLPTSKTLGNFLRRFKPEHIEVLKVFLTKMGYTLRTHTKRVHPEVGDEKPHFKIDGTPHEQHGSKMEGCGWMVTSRKKSVYGYASQTVFDKMGFCYAGELLAAKNFKGNPVELLDQVLSPLRGKKIDNPFEKVAHISGDSAYLTKDIIPKIQSHHATFTIAAPKTTQWDQHTEQLTWTDWEYSEEQLKKLKKKGKAASHMQLGRWHWTPGWSKGQLKFPIVVKREYHDDEVFGEACGSWHYHAVATNCDLTHRTYQSVIEQYRPRAEVENQIKEFKINFDAKHLPCLSKDANEVYFLFVLIAQNLTRWAAVLEKPDKPHYAKKIRRKLINAPGQILTGSRQLTLRVKGKFLKEVQRFLEAWGSEPVTVPLFFSTA